MWLRWSREVAARAEDVGERFVEEARRIHEGTSEDRLIRGRATPQQAMALVEDGIPVVPLPALVVSGETLQ